MTMWDLFQEYKVFFLILWKCINIIYRINKLRNINYDHFNGHREFDIHNKDSSTVLGVGQTGCGTLGRSQTSVGFTTWSIKMRLVIIQRLMLATWRPKNFHPHPPNPPITPLTTSIKKSIWTNPSNGIVGTIWTEKSIWTAVRAQKYFTRTKVSRWGIIAPGWSTKLRKDALRRVGKIDSHYSYNLSPTPEQPSAERETVPVEGKRKVRPTSLCTPEPAPMAIGGSQKTSVCIQDSGSSQQLLSPGAPAASMAPGSQWAPTNPGLQVTLTPASSEGPQVIYNWTRVSGWGQH